MAKLVRAFVREDKVCELVAALQQCGVDGVTVTKASGRGQRSPAGSYRGVSYPLLLPMGIVEVIASDAAADTVCQAMLEHAHTGYHGDGHLMIWPIEQRFVIRTRWLDVA